MPLPKKYKVNKKKVIEHQLTFVAFVVRVAGEVIGTAARGPVSHDRADGIDAARALAGVDALVVDAGLAQKAVRVDGALRPARLAKVPGQAGAHGLVVGALTALRVGAARVGLTR